MRTWNDYKAHVKSVDAQARGDMEQVEEIAEIVEKITESDAIIVMIHGEHSCMTSRGIKKPGTLTTTVTYRGERINQDSDLRQELLMLMK